MRRPQNSFWNLSHPQNYPIRAPKSQNNPKIRSKSKNWKKHRKWKFSTRWVDLKTVFKSYPNPKNSPLGPRKVKNDPKIKSKPNVMLCKVQPNYVRMNAFACRKMLIILITCLFLLILRMFERNLNHFSSLFMNVTQISGI